MRSSVAFALITVNVACWTTVAAAEDTPQPTADKRGKIVATAPRQVDTTYGTSTAPGTIQTPVLSATAVLVSVDAGSVTPRGGSAANGATTIKIQLQPASVALGASAAGVSVTPTLRETTVLVTAADRTGAVASIGSIRTTTVQPMGTGATAVNLTASNVRPAVTTQESRIASLGGVLSVAAALKTGLTQGLGVTNLKAAVLADAPSGPQVKTPGAETPRSVGVWNNATSMIDPAQRPKPIRHR